MAFGMGRGIGGGPRSYLTEEEKQNRPKVTKELLFRILAYLKPYRMQFVFVFFAILLSAVIGLFPSLITGRIVDEGHGPGTEQHLCGPEVVVGTDRRVGGHGDVASDPVGARGLVLAQGRVHIERTARHQAVCDVVLDCTDGPSVFRDPLAEQLFLARYQEWLISRRLRTPAESAINSLALYLNELEPTRRDRGKYQAR